MKKTSYDAAPRFWNSAGGQAVQTLCGTILAGLTPDILRLKRATADAETKGGAMPRKSAMLALALTLSFLACQSGVEQSAPEGKASSEQNSHVRTYVATGVIQRLDPEHLVVVIQHERIEGFMEAMTMPFHAERAELLVDLRPGDKVRFTLRQTPQQVLVTQIERLP